MKKNNKKGFTLAELLIVVAIIAVLTAIAVPLFVGALNDAEQKVAAGNCRAVRGLAISQILKKESTIDDAGYYGYGKVAANGEVSDLDYVAVGSIATSEKTKTWKITFTAGQEGAGSWTAGAKTPAGETPDQNSTEIYLKDGNDYYVVVKIVPTDFAA